MLILDPANMTESSSHPHLRKAQVSQQLVDRAVNVGSQARTLVRTGATTVDDSTIVSGEDVWLIFDGGRSIENVLLKPFRRSTTKQKIPVIISYDEDAMLTNIGRVTTINSLRCTDTMFLIAAADWNVPRRPHQHFKGSNYSDTLGPVHANAWEDEAVWKLSRKENKSLMSRFKIEAGGGVDTGLSTTSKWKLRETEPVWFHAKPYKLADELVFSYLGKSVVDFAPSNGMFAMVAMRRRLPYVGLTCSDGHSNELMKYLLDMVKAAMQDPEDHLHRADCCNEEAPGANKRKTPAKDGNNPDPAKPGGNNVAKVKRSNNTDLMQKLKSMMQDGEGGTGGEPTRVQFNREPRLFRVAQSPKP